jgi:hypothetical protein
MSKNQRWVATNDSEIHLGPWVEREMRYPAKGCGHGRGIRFASPASFPSYDQRIRFQIERFVHAMMLDADAISLVDEVEAQGVFVELDFA